MIIILTVLLFNFVALVCIVTAAYMAINHIGGWGWFFAGAMISNILPKSNENSK